MSTWTKCLCVLACSFVLLTQDDPDLFDYNVDERVKDFIKDILLQAGNLRTNNVMFTFGSDFQYENAIEYYKNLDKLMKYTMEKVGTCMYLCMCVCVDEFLVYVSV